MPNSGSRIWSAASMASRRSFCWLRMEKPGAKSRLRIRGPRLLNCHEPAAPPLTASSTLATSTPARVAKVNASAIAMLLPTTRIWLTSLHVWPAPVGPMWVIFLPIASNTGRTRSTTAASPPIMMDSVAFRAPTSPPLTGASSMAMPLACSVSAISRVVWGEMVLMSTTTAPGCAP